jgi:hypothetical protein
MANRRSRGHVAFIFGFEGYVQQETRKKQVASKERFDFACYPLRAGVVLG